MKIIILSYLLFFINTGLAQSNPFIAPDLDREVLHLRHESILCNQAHVRTAYDNVVTLWTEMSNQLIIHLSKSRAQEIASCQGDRLEAMKKMIESKDFGSLTGMTETFFNELVNLRSQFEDTYPLDHLWQTKLLYDDLKSIIHDQMLELLEWNEIDRIYENMNCSWQEYELLYQDLIPIYFTEFNILQQKSIFDDMAGCLDRLRSALDGGYRPDFILPCDDIGKLIEENLAMYASPSPGSL